MHPHYRFGPWKPPEACDELGNLLADYYGGRVESANALAPLDDWETHGDEMPAGLDAVLEESSCTIETLLVDVLHGLADAESTSFVATFLRWSTIGRPARLPPPILDRRESDVDEHRRERRQLHNRPHPRRIDGGESHILWNAGCDPDGRSGRVRSKERSASSGGDVEASDLMRICERPAVKTTT